MWATRALCRVGFLRLCLLMGMAACSSEEPESPPTCGPGTATALTTLHGYIAFVADGPLGAVCPDGTDLRSSLGLTLDTGLPFYFDVSPDGRQVLVSYSQAGRAFDLFDVTTGSLTHLSVPVPSDSPAPPEPTTLFDATWSRDGQRVAYVVGLSEVVTGEVSGGAVINPRLQANYTGTQPTYTFEYLDWSPQGDLIAYPGTLHFGFGGVSLLYVDNPGHFIGRIDPSQPLNAEMGAVEWSPDGTHLAYDTCCSASRIWIMKNDGASAVPLTTGDADVSPSWSPDGAQLAFVRSGDIWIVPVDGGSEHRIADLAAASASQVQWVW